MSDTPTATMTLDGLDIDKLLALRRERRRIDAEIAALLDPAGATTLPTWGPCTRCGHVWQGRSQRRPGHCAGCASAYWDKEPVRSTAGKPGTPRRKRSRRSRKKAAASVTSMPSRTPLASDADFIAAIRSALPPPPKDETSPFAPRNTFRVRKPDVDLVADSATGVVKDVFTRFDGPPPPAMTPPPPFLVRPTPPPRYVPTVEEPQPESVASHVHITEIAHYPDDLPPLPPVDDDTIIEVFSTTHDEAAPRDLTREYLEEAADVPAADDPAAE